MSHPIQARRFSLNAGSAQILGEFSEKIKKNKKSAALGTTPLALILSACGSSNTESNVLTLTKSGSTYSASTVTGFTVTDTSSAKFDVADSTSNAYEIKLSATGTGVLEFDFVDVNDTVTLAAGSKTSGFTTLKVTDGTIDATNADLTGITRVEVASGIKISLAQIKVIPTIVANSATSEITVQVASEAEATELVSLISAGTVKVYGDTNPIKLVAAPAATVATETLTSKQTETTASVKPKTEAPADTAVTETTTTDTTTDTTTTTTTTTSGGGGGGVALDTFSAANVSGGVTFDGNATGDISIVYDSATTALNFTRGGVNDMSTPLIAAVSTITIGGSETVTSTVADHNTISGQSITFAGSGTYKFTDAGTATGLSGIGTYTLGNGTNTFTLLSGATQAVTGGTGADTVNLTAGTHTVNGAGGTDILKVSQGASGTTIADAASLSIGVTSQQTWSGSNKVTVSNVENIDASAQLNTAVGMTLTGGTAANVLTGGSGNDTLVGGQGADTLNGGVGTGDVVSYADITAASAAQHGIADASIKGVAINLSAAAVAGSTMNTALTGTVYLGGGSDATSHGANLAAGKAGYIVVAGNSTNGEVLDTISNVEGAVGSARNDYIALGAGGMSATAGDGADVVVGGAGDDTIIGGAGADTLNGAAGTGDILSYSDITAASAAQHGIADASIKGVVVNVSGSALAGTAINAAFTGTVYLGGGSNATSHGSNLADGKASYIVAAGNATGGGVIDTVSNFESLVGSARADYFALGSGGLTVDGGAGIDVIVNSGTGVDTLTGGAGNDVFAYASSAHFITAASGADAVIDLIDGGDGTTDTIQITGAIGIGAAGTDTLARVSNTEVLSAAANADGSNNYAHAVTIASDAAMGSIRTLNFAADVDTDATTAVTLTGVAAATVITGVAAGANTITGGAGADTITGGTAIDTIDGGAGTDVITLTESAGSVVDIVKYSSTGADADLIIGMNSRGTDLIKLSAGDLNLRNGNTDESGDTGYVEISSAAADAAAASGANDTVIELSQLMGTAASAAVDAYQAAANSTTLAAMITAIAGDTASGKMFDGGLNAVFDDATDKVVFIGHTDDGSSGVEDTVAILYTAGAGGGTADTTIDVGEISILFVADGNIALTAIADL